MRYPSGKSLGFSMLIWGVIAVLSAFLTFAAIRPMPLRFIVISGSLIVILFMLWIWFGTYYVFTESHVLLRMGPFIERIPYERITSAKKFKSMASSMALSSEMIELRHGKNYITGTTYLSPENRDEFLAELAVRCSNLLTGP